MSQTWWSSACQLTARSDWDVEWSGCFGTRGRYTAELVVDFSGIRSWFQIVIGAGFGVFIMLSGIWVTEANRVVAFSLYALVLSALAAFLLYCLVQGFVDQVHLYWLGGIVGAGLYTVFVGLPRHGIETPDSPPGL